MRKTLLRKELLDLWLGDCSTPAPKVLIFCTIHWIYKDAIDLTSRRMVRLRQNNFQNEVTSEFYKLVLVRYPLDHYRRIESPQASGSVKN